MKAIGIVLKFKSQANALTNASSCFMFAILLLITHRSTILPAYEVRWEVIFILGNVCSPPGGYPSQVRGGGTPAISQMGGTPSFTMGSTPSFLMGESSIFPDGMGGTPILLNRGTPGYLPLPPSGQWGGYPRVPTPTPSGQQVVPQGSCPIRTGRRYPAQD